MKKNNSAFTVTTATGAACTVLAGIAATGTASADDVLPVPAATGWVGAGQATGVVSGTTFNVNQTSQNVSLNWQSFNIGSDNTVNFLQPSETSVALNRIFQLNPVDIRGKLNANGEVYLLSQNGIVFGETAQVNVRGLIASTLNITQSAEDLGLTAAIGVGRPAFEAALDADGNVLSQDVEVLNGARITTPSGGRVFMFAPNVTNQGTIKTPDGQTALAAGNKIYLSSIDDPSIRGLVVEVGEGGTVTNGSVVTAGTASAGTIQADRGNVSLVGLAVNQLGRVSASTAVRSAGSIRLIARESTVSTTTTTPARGGTLTFGANSVTAANPDLADTELTLDANEQPKGRIDTFANEIFLRSDSLVSSKSGVVNLTASPSGGFQQTEPGASSRIYMEDGSRIDVSGEFLDLPASRNSLTVRLQGAELRDSPVQRDSPLRGQLVTVDVRRHGTTADGRNWVGTPLADLNEASQGVRRSVAERSSIGGTVNFDSQGDVILAPGSSIDVSGGGLRYADGAVQTTMLVRQGVITDIANADPNIAYDGIFGAGEKVHSRWGVIEEFQSAFVNGTGASQGAGRYFEGKDAGSVQLNGARLILDGALQGGALRGEFQRSPATTFTGSQRPIDQAPRGGRLVLGAAAAAAEVLPNFRLGSATFGLQPVLPNIPAFDPLHDPMPELAAGVTIPVSAFGEGNFSALEVYANGNVSLLAGVNLDLGPGGDLEITAGEIDFGGMVTARSGSVSLLARDSVDLENAGGRISFADAAAIDVSGLWTNDMHAIMHPGMPFDRLIIDGGSIRIEARQRDAETGGLYLGAGSRLDADGGAWLNSAGRVTAGRGGGISLVTRRGILADPVALALDGEISAYGLENGGTLSVQASNVCLAVSLCADATPESTLWLTPDFLRTAGFRSYSFTADGGGITVPAETHIELRQQNRVLDTGFDQYADRSPLETFTSLGQLPDVQRKPVDLSLAVRVRFPATSSTFFDEDLRAAGYLSLGTGAEILADPGTRIDFSSDTRMFVDGTISAPAGTINLTLASAINGTRFGEFMPSQSLWLGSEAALLAPGASRILTDGFGRRSGDVLAAGTVRLDARSGYVVAEQGSRIDVSGVSDELDITSVGGPNQNVSPQRTSVAADAGQIEIKAAEGILFAGSLEASAAGNGARSGSLTIELNANQRNDNLDLGITAEQLGLSTTPRTIVVSIESMDDAFSELVAGAPIGIEHNSRAVIAPGLIANGNFGDVALRTRYLDRDVVAPGRIRFEGDVGLGAARRLMLDAAGIESNGGTARLSAPYVAIGHQDTNTSASAIAVPDLVSRGGSLAVSADLIDIFGSSRLLGMGSAAFVSNGDIRLRGLQIQGRTDVTGRLESTGDLHFGARQIYAPTLNTFTVAVRDNPEGHIVIDSTGAATPVLSAGSHLTFEAADILQGGVIKAPLGEIVLNASRDLTLAAGSITSTSLENQLVPFGRIEVGTDWVYALDASGARALRLVFTEQANRPADELPRQNVHLEAPSVTLAEGAVLDQSGGGDLLGYEFQSGLSGSFDVLDPVTAPRNYAVVPTLAASFAPIDAQESLLFGLRPGESVEFASDLPGLPSGRYALLPARYALLPGAFLVTAVSGYSDLAPGAVLPFAQGGSVIAGRRVFANGLEGDSRTSGFVIRNQTDIARLAKYDTYRANTFATGFGGVPLPRDGGSTQIEAALNVELGGSIRAAGAAGGRGATVEITGGRLAVVADRNQNFADVDALLLDADGLNRLGAESLILGATRSFDADGAHLDVTAQQVEIDQGVDLHAPEIILAATDTVRVETGAEVAGRGTTSSAGGTLSTQGDGALLRVSASGQGDFLRIGASGSGGILDVEAGADVAADQSTLLSGSADVRFAGNLLMDRGSLAVDAASINLGAADAPNSGFTLTGADLAALSVDELRLSARQGIDIFEPLDFELGRVVLRAPAITGHLDAGEIAVLNVDSFELANPALFTSAPTMPTGAGTLEIRASNIGLGVGDVAIDGFEAVTLTATNAITARGAENTEAVTFQSGHLAVDGDLNLTAGVVTGEGHADLSIEATGAVRIDRSGSNPILAGATELGAKLAITGASIQDFGRIELKSGSLALRATGTQPDDSVTLGAGASIDVTGSVEHFADKDVFAHAGVVSLSSEHGNIELLAGSRIDLSANAGGGDAGRLDVRAPSGTTVLAGELVANAADTFAGGSATLDVGSLDNFSTLNQLLAVGGFDNERNLRVRTGDVTIGAGDVVRASAVSVTTDSGSIVVAGRLDVSGGKAGSIELNAHEDVRVAAGAALVARATDADRAGGHVALRSVDGGVRVENGANIDVSAGPGSTQEALEAVIANRGGRVDVRVSRDSALSIVDGDATNDELALQGSIVGARRIALEAYEQYVESDGELDATDVSTFGNFRFDDAATFINDNGAAIRTALGANAAQTAFHLLAGIEIATDELNPMPAMRLTSTWDLSQWRFGGEAGVLTLRSAGDLNFDQSLSDGFQGVSDLDGSALPLLLTDDSWSYRLVAGADLTSADSMAVSGTGNITLAPGTVGSRTFRARPNAIRTGTGDIELAASGDVTLGNGASVIYTAGKDLGQGILLGSVRGTLVNRPYPLMGGDVSVAAGGSIRGVSPDGLGDLNSYGQQLITNWLYRQGASDELATGANRRATGWTVAFERFEQGIGALAGGDVAVVAGGELNNLSLSIPSIGMQVGSESVDGSVVDVVGGGDLTVRAVGDIAGGTFFVGKGDADIRTGGSVRSGRIVADSHPDPLHTILALGEGHITLDARGTLDLESVVNPTLIVQAPLQRNLTDTRNSFFSTYGDDSSVKLSSLAGDVAMYNNRQAIEASGAFGLDFIDVVSRGVESLALVIYPPVFEAAAFRGDINMNGGFTLFPSASGDLQLLADQNIGIRAPFSLPDVDPGLLPSVANASPSFVKFNALDSAELTFATAPTHLSATSVDPARFVARSGDIVSTGSTLFMGKHAEFHAGRDLNSLNVLVQNVSADDVSVFSAGRDISYPSLRDPGGRIIPGDSGIDVQGPGRLLVTAGRDIDLGASRGISSLGDSANPALADEGADITLMAGLGARGPALEAFADKYDVAADLPSVLDKFYAILRASGRKNAPLPNEQRSYADAFDAIKILFPESDYQGSMDMFFSRVYTLDGGDIDLLLPGGAVNVGLAAPPSAFGVAKEASQLGLVAQSSGNVRAFLDQNFEVNESRVFAADGGDILVWSSNGDIDAGRGAKTSISAPPPIINVDPDSGLVTVTFPPALTGSGIRTLTSTPGRAFGSVDLITPRGVVDASEAGIETLGNLTIAAVEVLGTQNIKVGGAASGVPVDTGGLAASLSSVSSVSNSANTATDVSASNDKGNQAPIADSAMSYLEVFVLGFGEGVCDPKDAECLKRQQLKDSSP